MKIETTITLKEITCQTDYFVVICLQKCTFLKIKCLSINQSDWLFFL